MPASRMTISPEAAINSAVPRSGWRAISAAGRITMPAITTSTSEILGGSGRSRRYQAAIIGAASFMTSEGWKRSRPTSSQR